MNGYHGLEGSTMDRLGIRVEPFVLDQPARIFLCPPVWPGPFDIEVDCIAVV